jgi:hypothetical protein
MRNTFRILITYPEGERTLGRFGHKWKDNMKINLKETG